MDSVPVHAVEIKQNPKKGSNQDQGNAYSCQSAPAGHHDDEGPDEIKLFFYSERPEVQEVCISLSPMGCPISDIKPIPELNRGKCLGEERHAHFPE